MVPYFPGVHVHEWLWDKVSSDKLDRVTSSNLGILGLLGEKMALWDRCGQVDIYPD